MNLSHARDIRVTCTSGIEPYLEQEIAALGLPVRDRARGAVITHGEWPDAWRLCLELRTALHVLFPLRSFTCRSPDDLYREALAMPWEGLIDADGYVSVDSRVDHPTINNSMFPNVRVKDAIVDRITSRVGRRPNSGPDAKGVVVHLHWAKSTATLSLSASGRKLADRGYRKRPHRAPLRESLAAAIVLATEWTPDQPLLLPMCGSGTLAIEAALRGLDRAPGLVRPTFSFTKVRGFDEDAWRTMRNATRKRAARKLDTPIIATDLDPAAIEAAQANAETAGVTQLIDFAACDFAETRLPETPGVLIVNPEYGARLGDTRELEATYARLGTFFKTRCKGWRCAVLSGNPELSAHIGLKAGRRIPFRNASIDCRLLVYDIWADRPGKEKPAADTGDG